MDEEHNQTIPILNAVFDYLNGSKNEFDAKIHLLEKVLMKTDIYHGEKSAKIMKDVKEIYEYIINVGLFSLDGNITGYLAGIINRDISDSAFRKILKREISRKYVDNICSTNKSSSKLTPLAIGKILEDYVWPVYVNARTKNANSDGQYGELAVNRFKRNSPFGSLNNTLTRNTDKRKLEETNVLSEELETALNSLKRSRFHTEDIADDVAEYLQSTDSVENMKTGDNGKSPFRAQSESDPSYQSDHDNNLWDAEEIRGTMYNALDTGSKIKNPIDINSQGNQFLYENSKRMIAIREAANYILIRCGHPFLESVNMLKGFLLKLEKGSISSPSYSQIAFEFCEGVNVNEIYKDWKIPSHDFIDDVLYKLNFDVTMGYAELIKKMGKLSIQKVNFGPNDYENFKSSSFLQHSLRLEDFFILKQELQKDNKNYRDHVLKRVLVALYRLGLRECEEEWIDNSVTLYRTKYAGFVNPLIHKIKTARTHTFNEVLQFTSNDKGEEKKYPTEKGVRGDFVWWEIQFQNLAGVINIDRLFENSRGIYVFPPPKTFKVYNLHYKQMHNKKVLVIMMEDTELKEKKMIDMINKLYKLLIDSPKAFIYYS